ncbi:prepilin-type N-terminal cleavage/methylation domain-containing protein [Actinoplanes bogorensis]|uniref:Prepilin-type N-terminal cleavage/methylation domain-containing protein n=1 Tax=Paractinoplanes bogorensis TaxID=1610840 RepID=A0ABS5Z031_9ACTN|nr:prepilin-type N-terminal cleavage/methylation domain-containing protein [Actinoplanes bogorensis]MBU2669054.1 prepilin-type N-terminal cleavage/methylation domain-containing protein [Actinoplanes bogorensis]
MKRDDDGVTLIEVLVAMLIMTVAGALATTAIAQIYRSTSHVEASFEAQRQIETMYTRLDTEIRYARSISNPGQVGRDWYVEYLLSSGSADTCVELRLNSTTREVQRRTWTKNAVPLAPSRWTVLATDIVATTPFTVVAADRKSLTGSRYQRMTLAMRSVAGGGRASSTQETDVTFTALNATSTADDVSTCTEARGVAS